MHGGIEDKTLKNIFDPHFTTKESGTGMGMYLVKMILEKIGGDIIIMNHQSGARFIISILLYHQVD
jgi:two-component system, sensor histidine kinase and response regulator